MLRAFVLFALFGFVVCDFEDVFEECFKKDSISCIQMKVLYNRIVELNFFCFISLYVNYLVYFWYVMKL